MSSLHLFNELIFRLLYIHKNLPVINSSKFSDKFCQAIVCTLSGNIILASVYRPPEAPFQSFCDLVNFLQNYLPTNSDQYQIVITGDFNFPSVSWEDLHIGSCTLETRRSAEYLLEFMSKNLLSQLIDKQVWKCTV